MVAIAGGERGARSLAEDEVRGARAEWGEVSDYAMIATVGDEQFVRRIEGDALGAA